MYFYLFNKWFSLIEVGTDLLKVVLKGTKAKYHVDPLKI